MLSVFDRIIQADLLRRGFTQRWVDTSAGRVHVLDGPGRGELPPVVLLHGLASRAAHFRPMALGLLPHVRRLIMPDLLGHGDSHLPLDGIDSTSLDAALVETLDEVLDEPALLFGVSLGGAGVLHYASLRPDKTLGLCLVSPGGALMDEGALRTMLDPLVIQDHAQALEFTRRAFTRWVPSERLFAWAILQTMKRPHVHRFLKGLRPGELLQPEALGRIQAPVRLLWGRQERLFWLQCLEYFRDHLPHAEVHRPERWGHAPVAEQPHEVVEHILELLRQVRRSEARGAA